MHIAEKIAEATSNSRTQECFCASACYTFASLHSPRKQGALLSIVHISII